MPTYAGGLGVLAADTLRAAADLGCPMVGITLLHRQGYFRQRLDEHGNQSESPVVWSPEEFLDPVAARVSVQIEGRSVQVGAWRCRLRGLSGDVTVYFLDTDLSENVPEDRGLTDHLYGGDERYRLRQEAILGFGGVALLRALGDPPLGVDSYHMNEGHAALLALALLEERIGERGLLIATEADKEAVRGQCVFTTHTPMPAGHDQFPLALAREVLGEDRIGFLEAHGCFPQGVLNMTYLALYFSRYINGVAMRHGEISRTMFPGYPISSITNGVHAATWTAPPFQRIFDRHLPEWRRDNLYLRYATGIPRDEIKQAHAQAKAELFEAVEERTRLRLDPEVLTIGFARRATAYKRADLFLSDINRLRRIVWRAGPLQVIFAGKAHPRDEGGKAIIRRIFQAANELRETLAVVYLEEYDLALARQLCAGVDLWLNTPQKPQEASGTSGMKAALNGVPSLSILDGWWIEGHIEGVTGWSIGDGPQSEGDPSSEVASLLDKLEHVIVPMFYDRPEEYGRVMRSAIALNGSFFNAQRMLEQYIHNAYAVSDGGRRQQDGGVRNGKVHRSAT